MTGPPASSSTTALWGRASLLPSARISEFLPLESWMIPLYMVLFTCGYTTVLLVSHSVEQEDISLFDAICRRTGMKFERIRALLVRFSA
ncbi:hypothetical protein LCGC14_2898460 [marine sediment metagenome]|uniref:ABC transmembrane type-1 domain-containing protein n=1 Tax=marine sediment metagenome TaxID=412755 RepID=A0A0F9A317_9ZZZZ